MKGSWRALPVALALLGPGALAGAQAGPNAGDAETVMAGGFEYGCPAAGYATYVVGKTRDTVWIRHAYAEPPGCTVGTAVEVLATDELMAVEIGEAVGGSAE